MTNNEKELVAALEGDIKMWEDTAKFFDTMVAQQAVMGGPVRPGKEYADGLRKRITEHKALIAKVKKNSS